MGNPARRTPRSTARAISLWLAKRILPLLAYRTISAGSDGKHTRRIRRGGGGRDAAALRAGHQPPPAPAPVPPRAGRDHGQRQQLRARSARSGSRCPWPGRRRSHSTASTGSPPPRRPRPGPPRPASPARASRGPARRRGGPTAAPRCTPAPAWCTSPGPPAGPRAPPPRARPQRSKEKYSLQPSNRAPSCHAALITAATRRSPRDSRPSMIDGLPSWYR